MFIVKKETLPNTNEAFMSFLNLVFEDIVPCISSAHTYTSVSLLCAFILPFISFRSVYLKLNF